jgi:hypothetical protein
MLVVAELALIVAAVMLLLLLPLGLPSLLFEFQDAKGTVDDIFVYRLVLYQCSCCYNIMML